MSYVDGNSGTGRKALTGGTVMLIQAGLALALVNGLAVTIFKPEPPRHLASQFFPTEPLPQDPVEQPRTEPRKPLVKQTSVDDPVRKKVMPEPQIPFSDKPMGTATGSETTGTGAFPDPIPSDPPTRFTPEIAKPRNDVARWVTTEDYPTADVRAGHTGTVRFRVAIDTGGRVSDCTIVQSSGYAGLDAATCRNISKRARFDPATDITGARVAGSYTGSIRWVIPRD